MINIDFSHIEEDELALWYLGKFEDDLTIVLIKMLNSTELSLGKSKKRISFLMAESFQNVIRHGNTDLDKSSCFGLFKKKENIHIFSSNIIPAHDVISLEAKLLHVNKLGKDELKNLFKEVIQKNVQNTKGGAGLGLIEMARKTGRDLQYNFQRKGDLSEFNLQLDKSLSKQDDGNVISIEKSSSFSKTLRDNGIILLFKGEFDTETIDNISRVLMQNTLYNEALGIDGKTFFHIAIEMLQNMARHGKKGEDKKNGVFMVQMIDQTFRILTKNYILEEDVDRINELLDSMKNLNSEELTQLYKKQLRLSTFNDEKNAGVGIIDIMRYTKGNLTKLISSEVNKLELTLTATLKTS